MDPHISDSRIAAHGFDVADEQTLNQYDLAAVLTDHSSVPYAEIAETIPQVFDARGIYRRLGLVAPNVQPL